MKYCLRQASNAGSETNAKGCGYPALEGQSGLCTNHFYLGRLVEEQWPLQFDPESRLRDGSPQGMAIQNLTAAAKETLLEVTSPRDLSTMDSDVTSQGDHTDLEVTPPPRSSYHSASTLDLSPCHYCCGVPP